MYSALRLLVAAVQPTRLAAQVPFNTNLVVQVPVPNNVIFLEGVAIKAPSLTVPISGLSSTGLHWLPRRWSRNGASPPVFRVLSWVVSAPLKISQANCCWIWYCSAPYQFTI